jgi:S-adenosylmethionine:tRNA ribosyltransferase-isomerase
VLVRDFDYELPAELIAQTPPADRAGARMLHLVRPAAERAEFADGAALAGSQHTAAAFPNPFEDRQFRVLPEILQPSDLVVLNNTRVFPARLLGRRSGARAQPLSPRNPAARDFLRGTVEALLTAPVAGDQHTWQALVRPGRKIGVGERLLFGPEENLEAEVIARGAFGERTLRFAPRREDFFSVVERIGHVPLPPYIARADAAADRERYQTIYARERGSVAAPTAGLHFTPEILEALRTRGLETAEITLHVGLGTFQPVRAERVEDHRLHRECFTLGEAAASAINRAIAEHRRIVAVGTTTVRTLEYVAAHGAIIPCSGEADIFIYPGFRFRIVGALLTNFHLPQSTLLMLVCAFAGRERVLAAYRHAVAQRYRFYSYGDCMLIE